MNKYTLSTYGESTEYDVPLLLYWMFIAYVGYIRKGPVYKYAWPNVELKAKPHGWLHVMAWLLIEFNDLENV